MSFNWFSLLIAINCVGTSNAGDHPRADNFDDERLANCASGASPCSVRPAKSIRPQLF